MLAPEVGPHEGAARTPGEMGRVDEHAASGEALRQELQAPGATGLTGPTGASGQSGATGPTGAPGPTGPAAAAGVVSQTVGPGGETTASTVFTDHATPGPTVTVAVPPSGQGLVALTATIVPNIPGAGGEMSFVSTGGSGNVAPSDSLSLAMAGSGNDYQRASGTFHLTGLSPGSHTFTAKYRTFNSGAAFADRSLIVMPLP
jgi:collagen type I alpha